MRFTALRPWLLVLLAAWGLAPAHAHARARRFYRARFETEALELELPGEIEIDSQLGGYYGDGPDHSRLLLPDVEIDVGVCAWLEIDLDAALSITQLDSPPARLAADPLWLSARLDALDWKDAQTETNFGVGVQFGPRLPSLNTPAGVGFAGLVLFGGGTRALHLVGNLGTLLDRGQSPAILYGVDAEYEMSGSWSLLGNVAAAHYFGPDPPQLLIDVGVSYQLHKRLAFSLLAVGGPFLRGDRAGGLFGVSYSFQAWGRAKPQAGAQSPGPN